MSAHRRPLSPWNGILVGLLAASAACQDDRGATITITDARASRNERKQVVVDVDLVAREGLGRNVGVYCTRVTFSGQAAPRETCASDLEDGDEKTARFVSDGDLEPGAAIDIRVRLGVVDMGKSLAAPGR